MSDFKLVTDRFCMSCQIGDVPMAEFPRRSYKPGKDDERWAKVLLCELCAGTFISLNTVHYPNGSDTNLYAIQAQVTHILLRAIDGLSTSVKELRAEVALLREDIQGPDPEEEDASDKPKPKPELSACTYCRRAIHHDGRAWLTNDGDELCGDSPEFGKAHEPEDEENLDAT